MSVAYQYGFQLFGIASALVRASEAFLGRLNGVIAIIVISWKYMKMEMEGVLITCRLIILPRRNAITLIRFLHCKGDLLRHFKHTMPVLFRKRIETFKMLIRHHDHMSGILSHEK